MTIKKGSLGDYEHQVSLNLLKQDIHACLEVMPLHLYWQVQESGTLSSFVTWAGIFRITEQPEFYVKGKSKFKLFPLYALTKSTTSWSSFLFKI